MLHPMEHWLPLKEGDFEVLLGESANIAVATRKEIRSATNTTYKPARCIHMHTSMYSYQGEHHQHRRGASNKIGLYMLGHLAQ